MIWQFGSTTSTGGDSPTDGSAVVCDNAIGGTPTFACNANTACTVANGGRLGVAPRGALGLQERVDAGERP